MKCVSLNCGHNVTCRVRNPFFALLAGNSSRFGVPCRAAFEGKRGIWVRWQANGLIRLYVAFLNRKMTGSIMEEISKEGTASSSLPLPRSQGFLKRLKTLRERSIRTWLDWEFSRWRSTNDLCFHSPGDRTYCALWQSFYYLQTGNILFELVGTKTERISSPLKPSLSCLE